MLKEHVPGPRAASSARKADLAVLLTLGALAGAYLFDAWRASPEVYNLIFVAPVTLLLLLLCLIEFVGQWRGAAAAPEAVQPAATAARVIALFAGYVLSLPWLGFDAGTWLFVSAFLRLHGERRTVWALGYGLAFSLPVALFFSAMLPYPMPMRLLASEY